MPKTINLGNISRAIAVFSDIHAGSPYAVWPDEPIHLRDGGGNVSALMNEGQKQLLKSWHQALAVCDEFNVDTIITLGDTIQGCNPKEGGRATMTPDMEVQKDGAELLLRDLVKDRTLHMLSGTQYHESLDTKIHRDLAHRLEKYAKKSNYHGLLCNLRLNGTNKTINLAHKSTNAMIYTSTVMERERVFLKLAEADGKLPHIDYQFRGHLHVYYHLDTSNMHLIQCPAWMAWFPYKDSAGLYGKMQPDIGFVLLLIDKQNRSILLHFLYDAPHIADLIQDEGNQE